MWSLEYALTNVDTPLTFQAYKRVFLSAFHSMFGVEFSWTKLEVKWDLSFETWKMRNFKGINEHNLLVRRQLFFIIDLTERATMKNHQ